KTGKLQIVKGALSEYNYRTGNYFSMTPVQSEKWSKLAQADAGGMALFDAADKGYKATTAGQQAKELALEMGMGNRIGQAIAARTAPDLYNYVARRNSALGTYARSLGGEVGVLTDQDIARVIQMFPSASDTA